MKTFLICLVVVLVAASVNAGEGKGKGKMGKKTCKDEPFDMKALFKGMKDCKSEMSGGTTDAPAAEGDDKKGGKWKKMMCMSVCMGKKNGVFKSDGTYDSDGASTWVKSVFPAKVQDDMKKGLDACAQASGSKFSMDDNCSGYKDFVRCQMKTMKDACGWKGRGGKGKGKGKGKKDKEADNGETEQDAGANPEE